MKVMTMTSECVLLGISILAVAMLMAITLEVSGIADVVRNWWSKRKKEENECKNDT